MGGKATLNWMRYAGLIFLIFLLTVSAASALESDPPQDPNGRPNIVFVVTDDASADLLPRMPIIQSRMVKLGTRIPNSFYSVAWCGPSRASMFTGRYPHNHGVGFCMDGYPTPEGGGAWNVFRNGRAASESSTYATWLRDSGYHTGYIGKYMNGYGGYGGNGEDTTVIPPGWDRWFGYLGDYDTQPTYRINENGTVREYPRTIHDTDYMSVQARAFIQQQQNSAKPWLLTVAPNAPHTPNWVAKRHRDRFPHATLPKQPNFDEADVSDKGSYVRGKPRLTAAEVETLDSRYSKRLRSMLSVDEMVGGILDTLRDTGQMGDTYVVLWNDNGYHLGNHRMKEGKLFPYEEDVRYPLIIRGPGVPLNRAMPQMISNTDIAPTFADMADAEPASTVDGRSFLPLLSHSPPAEWRDAVLIEFDGANHPDAPPPYRAIRTNDAKYIEWQGGDREFYNILADPFELNGNVNAAGPSRVAALEQRLRELENCAGESCRKADGGG